MTTCCGQFQQVYVLPNRGQPSISTFVERVLIARQTELVSRHRAPERFIVAPRCIHWFVPCRMANERGTCTYTRFIVAGRRGKRERREESNRVDNVILWQFEIRLGGIENTDDTSLNSIAFFNHIYHFWIDTTIIRPHLQKKIQMFESEIYLKLNFSPFFLLPLSLLKKEKTEETMKRKKYEKVMARRSKREKKRNFWKERLIPGKVCHTVDTTQCFSSLVLVNCETLFTTLPADAVCRCTATNQQWRTARIVVHCCSNNGLSLTAYRPLVLARVAAQKKKPRVHHDSPWEVLTLITSFQPPTMLA